jgi:N-acetylmuramoyl-L-alanine amidase
MAGKVLDARGKPVRDVSELVIHCSDSEHGNAAAIEKWHQERAVKEPWFVGPSGKYIGYHHVITQAGVIEDGRPAWEKGCHCKGHNANSIGICLIDADGSFKLVQIRKLVGLVNQLRQQYNIPVDKIFGHNNFSTKTCPGFNIADFRALLILQ